MPARTIPPERDLLQSRILVGIALPLLTLLALWQLMRPHAHATNPIAALTIALLFALLVRSLRAATTPAAISGALICLILIESGTSLAHSVLPPLTLLFLLTFFATRLGRTRKEAQGLAEARTGRRASQVNANLGIAALCAAFAPAHPVLTACCVAALAEATADTVSSEIGQAFGGTPLMLTSLRAVPSGTDGAITLTGSAAGIMAAAVVAVAAVPSLGLTPAQAALALAAGTAGLFFDSLVGATLERRGWINNDLVNLTSTAFAAAVSYALR